MIRFSIRDALRVPGLITLARLPLALAFAWFVERPVWAVAILLAAGTTDVLDGWVARRFHQETATGAALDAVMDKVFVLAVVVTLVLAGHLTVLEALLLGTRDVGEVLLLARLGLRGRGMESAPRTPNKLGKVATMLQFATLLAIMLGAPYRDIWVLAAAVCGAFAAMSYWIRDEHRKDGVIGAGAPR